MSTSIQIVAVDYTHYDNVGAFTPATPNRQIQFTLNHAASSLEIFIFSLSKSSPQFMQEFEPRQVTVLQISRNPSVPNTARQLDTISFHEQASIIQSISSSNIAFLTSHPQVGKSNGHIEKVATFTIVK